MNALANRSGKKWHLSRCTVGAEAVTGSCFRLGCADGQVPFPCGLFRGPKTEEEPNHRPFPFDPPAVLLIACRGLRPSLHGRGSAPHRGRCRPADKVVNPGRNIRRELDETFEPTHTGARRVAVAPAARMRPEQVARLDWRNDASRLFDVNHTLAGASDEAARDVLILRLRRALHEEQARAPHR